MKGRDEVSEDKLRGGFYTSTSLVDWALGRIAPHLVGAGPVRWLEPSAGDGAFVRGLGRFAAAGKFVGSTVSCIEIAKSEVERCRASLDAARVSGTVAHESFFKWAL